MQAEPAHNMIIECQAKDLGNTGLVTITQFKDALLAVHPELTDNEVKHVLREIEAVDGKIAYVAAITKHEL